MLNFDFYNPTRILFGEGQIERLARLVPAGARVLVLYGGGSIRANGTYDAVMSALKDHTVFEFGGIEPNPSYETLTQAIALVKRENVDYLVAVGGGSVIDGTSSSPRAPSWTRIPGPSSSSTRRTCARPCPSARC